MAGIWICETQRVSDHRASRGPSSTWALSDPPTEFRAAPAHAIRTVPTMRNAWARILCWWRGIPNQPSNIRLGIFGEHAASEHLSKKGMELLTRNYRTPRGEIDLIFRDLDCLVFVEVKTRSEGAWTRPADAVDVRKQQRISRAAETYLRRIDAPRPVWRFDVVEVLIEGEKVTRIEHLKNVFEMHPSRTRGQHRSGTSGAWP